MNQIKVSSLACSGDGGVETSLSRAQSMIKEACFDQPDVICLPETFAWNDLHGSDKLNAAEPLDGPFCKTMSSLASKHDVNILTALIEKDDDHVYNSMVWLDRQGQILGTYRKVFPTDYEMAEGIRPGHLDFNVFNTEFGLIGTCICFDLNFREVIERIASQGAKLVLHPTMFDGLILMKAWAKLYGMYFFACPYGSLVNPLGETLIRPWSGAPIVTADLNLDYVVMHADYNRDKFRQIKEKYGDNIKLDWRNSQSSVLLTSRHTGKSALSIAEEFELELEKDYYKRTAHIRDAFLEDTK